LVASATTVSRHHLVIEEQGDAWSLRDLGTTSGTWLQGERVSQARLSGRQEFVLGDPTTGDRMVTEAPTATGAAAPPKETGRTSGDGRRRLRVPVLAAAAVVAVILVAAGGIAAWSNLSDDDEEPANTELTAQEQVEALARGTVYLRWTDARGGRAGSGTV